LDALTVVMLSRARTSSSDTFLATSLAGSIWTRMAGFCWPPMLTWSTPESWLICCASLVSALSSSSVSGRVSEVTAMIRIGESAGFTLR
jgi:hypothetical protein